MKKILMVVRWPVGGIKTYFRDIYSQKCFADFEFTVIAPDHDFKVLVDWLGTKQRIRMITCANSNLSLYRATREELKNGYHLVHSHGFWAGAISSAVTIGRKDTLHLMTAHDVFTPNQLSGWKGFFKKHLLIALYKRIHLIHTVTADAQSNLASYLPGIPQSKYINILHGIDTDKYLQATSVDLRAQLGLADNIKLIGFFGRFMAQKGFRNLVRAIKILVDDYHQTDMVVCTHGWGGFIREDYEYINQLGLSDYFKQLPNSDDMGSSLKSINVVAMPSRWEACGLLGMEALCAGTSIVGTNCIGLREVLEGSPAPLVEPENAEQLARALSQLLKPNAQEKFQIYQMEAVSRFTIEKPSKALANLYHQMLDEHA